MMVLRLIVALTLAFVIASPCDAQQSKVGVASQPGVDIVTLKSGRALRGIIVKTDPAGLLTTAVLREWLKQSLPDVYQKAIADEDTARVAATEQLQKRLKSQLESPNLEVPVEAFLKQELERIGALPPGAKPAEPEQFIWVDVPHETASKVSRSSPDRQAVVMWSWSERLPNVETRDAADLERELKKRGIDPAASSADLSDRVPPRVQDDREWAARMALVEYGLGEPLDFQGTADVLVRSDKERKPADLIPVLQRVLRSQVNSFLKGLANESRTGDAFGNADWLKSAKQEADELSARAFRATRVMVKPETKQANIETAFAVRLPKEDWQVIWSHREIQDATKPRPDLEGRIIGDPQVKKVLDTARSFGFGADDQIRQAIRFGAATMVAQQSADSRFYEFRDRFLKRLDAPPLTW